LINLGALKNLSRAKKFLRGTIIAEAGSSTEMFVVLKGEVGIVISDQKQNVNMIATVAPGDFFGETALFLEKKPLSTAIALNDVIVLPINKDNVIGFIGDEPEIAFEIMKEMCIRLDHINTAYEKQNGHPWAEPPLPSLDIPGSEAAKVVKTKEVKTKVPAAPSASAASSSPTPAPAPAVQAQSHNDGFSLFPEGHGVNQLPLQKEDQTYLMDKSYTCPLCKKSFKARKVIPSKLMVNSTDRDLRNHFVGIEPLYYDIVTCPHCLYSADIKMFDKLDKPTGDLLQKLQSLRSEVGTAFTVDKTTYSVFAGYYLALLCAPRCFAKHDMETAKLLMKLSRIYQDCEDKAMEDQTVKKALDAYMYVYENIEIEPNQEQQLCIIMGELSLKRNDIKNAKNFFFKAKMDRNGTPLLKRQAENRISDIRDIEQSVPDQKT